VKCCTERLRVAPAVALLVLAASALCLRGGICVVSGQDEALSSVFADADSALQQAFVAVSQAEAAGANVSGLLVELDAAGQNLSLAEFVYAENYPSEAVNMADECTALANAVVHEAANLKSEAVLNARTALWQATAFSVVSAFVFVIGLVLIWVLFRRSYSGRLLRARPEVAA
jgi:hypothetical protein